MTTATAVQKTTRERYQDILPEILEISDRIMGPVEPEAASLVADVFATEGIQFIISAAIAGRRLSNQSAESFAPAEIADLKPEF